MLLGTEDKARILQKLWDKAVTDYRFFLWGNGGSFKGFVKTQDEHDEAFPVKTFPNRKYLRVLAKVWFHNKLIVIFKSRQMMISWLFCALIIWSCLRPGRRWIVCCKKFDAADELLTRMWTIYQNLPEGFRPKAKRKEGFIIISHPGADSVIQAAAQNAEDVRMYTCTGIWLDESAFTSEGPDIHEAGTATVMGGGWFIATSTPNGLEYFAELADIPGHKKELYERISSRFTVVGE